MSSFDEVATGKRPRRAKGERTEELFRDAARRVFARDGYLNAKVEDIAAEAGKSPASFYNYFENKRAVLAVLAENFHEDTSAAISGALRSVTSDEEALRTAITIWVRNYRERLGAMSGVFEASMVDAEFHELWSTIRAGAIQFIATGIRRAQKRGFCPGLDPVQAGSALSSMLEHYCFAWLAQGSGAVRKSDEQKAIETLTTIWFHAIYWRPSVD